MNSANDILSWKKGLTKIYHDSQLADNQGEKIMIVRFENTFICCLNKGNRHMRDSCLTSVVKSAAKNGHMYA